MDGRGLTTPEEDQNTGFVSVSVNTGGLWETEFTEGTVDDLKIYCLPTDTLLPTIKSCIQQWMRNDVDAVSMRRYIRDNDL